MFNVLLNSGNTCQAYEFTLLTLGESRLMPLGLYSQEKATRAEEAIINKLQEMELTAELTKKLTETCNLLLKCNSGLGEYVHPGSYPMHTFAKYLFTTLQPFEPELGYKIGLRAMRLSFLDEVDGNGPLFVRRAPRWYILGHVEVQQCNLASTMLNCARFDFNKLDVILESCSLHVHSSSHLFRLAQDCLRIGGEITSHHPQPSSCSSSCQTQSHWSSSSWSSTSASSAVSSAPGWSQSSGSSVSHSAGPWGGNSCNVSANWGGGPSSASPAVPGPSSSNNAASSTWSTVPGTTSNWSSNSQSSSNWNLSWGSNGKVSGLINVGFKLGLQVLRQTLKSVHRRRWEMVRWVVTCACEVGVDGVLYILRNWSELFTAAEAVGSVASCIMGGNASGNGNSTSESGRSANWRARLSILQQEDIAICARALAIECARKVSCLILESYVMIVLVRGLVWGVCVGFILFRILFVLWPRDGCIKSIGVQYGFINSIQMQVKQAVGHVLLGF